MANVLKIVVGVALIAVALFVPGAQFLLGAGISLTLSGISGMLSKKPKTNNASSQRLNKSLDPEAFRKIVLGRTCGGADLRYWEVYGSGDKQYDEVIAVAGHQIHAFVDFFAEENEVTFDGSGNATTAPYSGLLKRETNDGTVGNAALAVGAGTLWTSASKFRGSAHYALRWTYDQTKLPQGIPSRYTYVVEGAPVYDPRKDSTRGGSGAHRADDQTTWAYSTLDGNGQPIGRNNALQVLWYLIGWRIQASTGEQVLVCGRGVDLNDIDFSSFITAANDAEVNGYYTDCCMSTGDPHSTNESILTADGALGTLLDPGGLWTYFVNKDDTGVVDVDLGADDVLEGASVEWKPYHTMAEQYNRVVGSFIDPSSASLYQPKPYPQAVNTTYETSDGFKKRKTVNYQAIQDGALANKVSTTILNESRFQGEYTAKFNYRSLLTKVYGIARMTLDRYQWSSKLFRVLSMTVEADGVTMRLGEVGGAIWASAGVPTVPTGGSGGNGATNGVIPLTGVTVVPYSTVSGGATQPGLQVSWTTPPPTVTTIQVRYRVTGATDWVLAPSVPATQPNASLINLQPNTQYDVQTQTFSSFGVFSGWSSTITQTTGGYVAPPVYDGSNLIPDPDFSGGTSSSFSGNWQASNLPVSIGRQISA